MASILTVKNPTTVDFVHVFEDHNGKRETIEIKSGAAMQLPSAEAKDVAYHLAQLVLDAKGLSKFGKDHENVGKWLLGEIADPFSSASTVAPRPVAQMLPDAEPAIKASGNVETEAKAPAEEAPKAKRSKLFPA